MQTAQQQPTGTNEPDVEALLDTLITAKANEAKARQARVEAETALLPFLDVKTEGSTTIEIADYKVTVSQKLNRKLSAEGFAAVRAYIPEELRPIKITTALDDTGVKWLQNNEPQLYAIIADHLTVTPAKPSITVKVM